MSFARLRGIVLALGLLFGAGNVQAAPTVGLYLSMDGSGSISNTQFNLQVNGYVSALNTFFTNNPWAFGTVAIGANIFGRDVREFFAVQTITDATVLTSLTDAITNLNPGRFGINQNNTAIGDAVNAASLALLAFQTAQQDDLRLVIDVTTDGVNNFGANPTTAAAAAVAAGINEVNCLGIGAGASCTWVGSAGTNFGIVSFENLGAALAQKIEQEVIGVPEPMSLALFGMGLAGLGLMRRRAA